MTHVTSIGLDVHARSVSACAFDPFTGEVVQRSFGTDAGEIAAWIKGFEEPRAVYESGPTGFALCRQLRALGVDCAVGAVSRMQKPAAEKRRKNDRRDAAFLARLLATRNVVEVWVPPAGAEAA
ncbi:transposase, partial [Collinsella tanakaei]|nr:transposase [Collinsella tanakaei]